VPINFAISNKLKDLPDKSGVYIMKDATGQIIYIGKAILLKNRVRSYFNNSAKDIKVRAMVSTVENFEYIITLTEKDALSLEANLIKKHKPKYNILLKDDKHAPYIRIDLREDFPNIEITRRVVQDGAKYFGPYFFGIRVSEIIAVIKTAYRVRACGNNFYSAKRACLNHDIELCLAPCQKKVNKIEYREAVDKVVLFLSGKEKEAQRIIQEKMELAVENENFERAIILRDQLAMLAKLEERIVSDLKDASRNLDAVSIVHEGLYTSASVVIVRNGKMMGVINYPLKAILEGENVYAQFLTQYYSDKQGDIPNEIVVESIFDAIALEDYLSAIKGKKVRVEFVQKGTKKRLVDMATENAKETLVKSIERSDRDYQMHDGANERLGELLGITNLRRIECYDISHFSGQDTVASGVCFINGRPSKKEYRRYKIKSHDKNDDFASLAEVIKRRMERAKLGDEKFTDLPDLIVIDGGKGQLSSAYESLLLSIGEGSVLPHIISLAKKEEEIYTLSLLAPIILPKNSFILQLLQRIRDEAHRFAITYQRTLRSKRNESLLEKIPNIGKARRRILLTHFLSIEKIKAASLEELTAIDGIDQKTAKAIIEYFSNITI